MSETLALLINIIFIPIFTHFQGSPGALKEVMEEIAKVSRKLIRKYLFFFYENMKSFSPKNFALDAEVCDIFATSKLNKSSVIYHFLNY